MIHIKKGKEPRELTEYRCTSQASYENMPKAIKEAVLKSLLEEQHELCVYCTCRLPDANALKHNVDEMTIEHLYPRNPNPDEGEKRPGSDLEYRNLFAVCSGNKGCGCQSIMTCDASKDNHIIHINPCDTNIWDKICYHSDGSIYSQDSEINNDLTAILNLNSKHLSLPANRLAVQTTVQRRLFTKKQGKREAQKVLDALLLNPEPFCGMAISWLRSKLQ